MKLQVFYGNIPKCALIQHPTTKQDKVNNRFPRDFKLVRLEALIIMSFLTIAHSSRGSKIGISTDLVKLEPATLQRINLLSSS